VRTGRPRAFEVDKALDRALRVFWHKGYEGASLSDLTKAMGINRPSLYSAFGDKKALFRKALDRYVEGPACFVREALDLPTAREVVRRLLYGGIDLVADPSGPKGCLMVQGALACGEEGKSVQRELSNRRATGEADVRRRFERAKSEGDLPRDTKPADLARFVVTIMRGMAVQAAGGASRRELRQVAAIALRAWPK
jgi:AcrR family transcriptional regulator